MDRVNITREDIVLAWCCLSVGRTLWSASGEEFSEIRGIVAPLVVGIGALNVITASRQITALIYAPTFMLSMGGTAHLMYERSPNIMSCIGYSVLACSMFSRHQIQRLLNNIAVMVLVSTAVKRLYEDPSLPDLSFVYELLPVFATVTCMGLSYFAAIYRGENAVDEGHEGVRPQEDVHAVFTQVSRFFG